MTMEDPAFENYRQLIGGNIEYDIPTAGWKGQTTKYFGRLEDVRYNEGESKFYAIIQRLHRSDYKRLINSNNELIKDTVPFEHVKPLTFSHPSSANSEDISKELTKNLPSSGKPTKQEGNGNLQWSSSSRTLQYGDNIFEITTSDKMKVGDEVVWIRDCPSRLNGKITWIGGISLDGGGRYLVAVVHFTQQTHLLPHYLNEPPYHRNIVPLNELQPFSIWLTSKGKNDIFNSSDVSANGKDLSSVQPFQPQQSKSTVIGPGAPSVASKKNSSSGKHTLGIADDSAHKANSGYLKTKTTDSEALPRESMPSKVTPPVIKSKVYPNDITYDSTSDSKGPSTTKRRKDPFRWDSKISPDEFCSTISNGQNERGKRFGIQGRNNSCYMDASIFSLFAFNNSLDNFLSMKAETKGVKLKKITETMTNTLTSKIIIALRKKYFVSSKRMNKLRKLLIEEIGKQYESSYMDAEEFIIALFQLLNVSGLFTYNHGGEDYIHQIVLPTGWDESQKTKYLTLQHLLQDSFLASDVKLAKMPNSSFIIKFPVSDGKLIPCEGVIPNVTLDLSGIVDDIPGRDENQSARMHLHAVICLRSNHFVTFVCMDYKNSKSRWVMMDSNPTTSAPEVHILDGISSNIKQAEQDVKLMKREPTCGGFKLFSDAYICVYVPDAL